MRHQEQSRTSFPFKWKAINGENSRIDLGYEKKTGRGLRPKGIVRLYRLKKKPERAAKTEVGKPPSRGERLETVKNREGTGRPEKKIEWVVLTGRRNGPLRTSTSCWLRLSRGGGTRKKF